MKVVKVRSPFIIEVNEAGAIGSKIDILIWQYGGSSTSPIKTYTLSKSNPSTTQLSTVYNVSNYVKEYIENIKPSNYNLNPNVNIYVEENNEWVFFQIKRYKLISTTYTLLDTTDYVGINGFTNYTDGNQNPSDTVLSLLGNTDINFNYYKNLYSDLKMEYANLLLDKLSTTVTSVKYERIDGGVNTFTTNFLIGLSGIYNVKIPITSVIFDGNFVNGCKVTITSTPLVGSPTVYIFNTYPTEECKYEPVRCSFINRYGGWKDIIFFKAQTNSINTKGTDYKLTQNTISYNTSIGQYKTFNINGKQTVKLNTGWVDENYSELITDLLLSETVLLDDKPVTVKTQGSDLKTYLKNNNINYELEFEYAYNLINDVL